VAKQGKEFTKARALKPSQHPFDSLHKQLPDLRVELAPSWARTRANQWRIPKKKGN